MRPEGPTYSERPVGSVVPVLPPDGQQVLTASDDMVKIWSGASGECLRTLEGHRGFVYSAVLTPDGQQVLTASDDMVRIWSGASGECLRTLEVLAHAGRPPGFFCAPRSSRQTGSKCSLLPTTG